MSEFDEYRPPQEERANRYRKFDGTKPKKKRKRPGAGAQDGSKEERMAEDFEFSSYYGKPVVKAPPWEWPIGAYLFLGGLSGGSALLAAGASATKNEPLARSTRIAAFTAAAGGSVFLVLDLGRPERLLNMFRVFKVTSPMSVGSWILGSFATAASLPALYEADKLTKQKLPLPRFARKALGAAAGPAGVVAGVLGGPLAGYTAVLWATPRTRRGTTPRSTWLMSLFPRRRRPRLAAPWCSPQSSMPAQPVPWAWPPLLVTWPRPRSWKRTWNQRPWFLCTRASQASS